MRLLLLLAVLSISFPFELKAQNGTLREFKDSIVYKDTLVEASMRIDHRPLRVGAFGGIGFDQFQGQNLKPSLATVCDTFNSGSGLSPNFGLQADLPLWGDLSDWTVVPRLSYETYRAKLEWTEADPVRLPNSLTPTTAHFTHILEPVAKAITFAPLLAYHPFSFVDILIGPEISLLLSQKYTRSTEAVEPGFTFSDGSRTRIEASGGIPQSRLLAVGLYGSVGFEVPLSRMLRAIPEAGISLPLNGITSHFTVQSFRAGIGFEYDLTRRSDTVTIYNKVRIPAQLSRSEVVTASPRSPKLSASISAVALDKAGVESKILTISVQEVRSRSAFPILNYIFFDEGSSVLPTRYLRYESLEDALHSFKGSDERHDAHLLKIYLETLNILGDRLRKNPRSTVTLVGNTSNIGVELGRIDLAKSRAEAVKSYFVKVWGIQPDRIRTEARLLPEHPSPSTLLQGQEENRRVEIRVSDESLLDPVTVVNTERVATPPNLRVIPQIETEAGMARMRTAITTCNGHELISSESGPEGESSHKMWTLNEEVLSQLSDSLYLSLNVKDSAGNEVTARSAIPLQITHMSSEKREGLERFSLILFGFDESAVNGRNARLLGQIASTLQALNPERISIVGYTDEMGDPAHNDQLSEQRALAAENEVEIILSKMRLSVTPKVLPEGRGSREQLYNNALPEGRFFSRTVNITIERSLK